MVMFNYILLAADAPEVTTTSTGNIMMLLMLFMLAIFVGVEIITKIPPTLHTPLMSGSNAISGITIIGALLALNSSYGPLTKFLGCLAVILATVNVVGGFMVTHRMLGMFKTKKKKAKTE